MRAAIAIVVVLAGSAAADETPETGYRVQTGVVDGAALVACAVAGAAAYHTNGLTKAPAAYSIGTFVLAVPILHAIHGRPARAIGSLAMRFFLPLAASGLAAAAVPDRDFNKAIAAAGAAFAVGVGVAIVDNLYLAGPDEPKPTWSPTVQVSRAGVALGVQSSF